MIVRRAIHKRHVGNARATDLAEVERPSGLIVKADLIHAGTIPVARHGQQGAVGRAELELDVRAAVTGIVGVPQEECRGGGVIEANRRCAIAIPVAGDRYQAIAGRLIRYDRVGEARVVAVPQKELRAGRGIQAHRRLVNRSLRGHCRGKVARAGKRRNAQQATILEGLKGQAAPAEAAPAQFVGRRPPE